MTNHTIIEIEYMCIQPAITKVCMYNYYYFMYILEK